jgi:hypothetical protein
MGKSDPEHGVALSETTTEELRCAPDEGEINEIGWSPGCYFIKSHFIPTTRAFSKRLSDFGKIR